MKLRAKCTSHWRRTLAVFAAAGIASGWAASRSDGAAVASYSTSTINGSHDVDNNTASPTTFTSGMTGITATAALLSPFNGTGHAMTEFDGNSKAKGGAGHAEGSNLAKITFPSGTGVTQTDPSTDNVGPSIYQMDFDMRWNVATGSFGTTSGYFTVPVAASVGSGAGAFAQFQCHIVWEKSINGGAFTSVRSNFDDTQTFGPGTNSVVNITSTVTIPPFPTDSADGVDQVRMSGYIRFAANNDGSPTAIQIMGPNQQGQKLPPDTFDELIGNVDFSTMWNDPSNLQYHYDASSGLDENVPVPEPTSLMLAGPGMLLLFRRTRRTSN